MLANHEVIDPQYNKAPDRTGNKQQEHQYTSSPHRLSCNICTTKAAHRILRLFNNSSVMLVLTVYPGSDGEELKRSKQSGKEKDESTDEWGREKEGKEQERLERCSFSSQQHGSRLWSQTAAEKHQ